MSSNKLYVAQIVESTSTDGVGLRNALYVSGCNFHCPGCHNEKWWPLNSGQEMEIEEGFEQEKSDDDILWIPDFSQDVPFPSSFADPSPLFLELKRAKSV